MNTEMAQSPRLVILGDLPDSLLRVATASAPGGKSSLRTRLEGIAFDAESGLAQREESAESQQVGHVCPSLVVEAGDSGQWWRADLRLDDSPHSTSSSFTDTATMVSVTQCHGATSGPESFALPHRGVWTILKDTWREGRTENVSSASGDSSDVPVTAPPAVRTEVKPPLSDRQAVEDTMPPPPFPAHAKDVRASVVTLTALSSSPSAATADTPSALATDGVSAEALRQVGGPHWPLVQSLIHTLARAPSTLTQLTQAVKAKQGSRLASTYTQADVKYVLDVALCSPPSRAGGQYTLRPDVFTALVEVDDFPRGTPQHEVAAKLFRLLDPTDPVQRAKRDALAYLVDRDVVLAAYDAGHTRHSNEHATASEHMDPPPVTTSGDRAEDTAPSSSASASRKREREERGEDRATARPPLFTSLKQLDVHWADGDLRLLLSDEQLSALQEACTRLQTGVEALSQRGELPAAVSATTKSSAKSKTTRSMVGATTQQAMGTLRLDPVPIRTAESRAAARALYDAITEHVESLATSLRAHETVRAEMDLWLRQHGSVELCSPSLWAEVSAYWTAQATRLPAVHGLFTRFSDLQYLVYRDLRDYEDLTRFGVCFPTAAAM